MSTLEKKSIMEGRSPNISVCVRRRMEEKKETNFSRGGRGQPWLEKVRPDRLVS